MIRYTPSGFSGREQNGPVMAGHQGPETAKYPLHRYTTTTRGSTLDTLNEQKLSSMKVIEKMAQRNR